MATLRFEGDEIEVPDGEMLLEFAEKLGVPFGCQDGICGTCRCQVPVGIEHLGAPNDKEVDMDLAAGERLVCQCKIAGGVVELEIE